MTPEEIQKTMDFILRSQADAAVRHEELQSRVRSLTDVAEDLVHVSRRTIERTSDIDRRLRILVQIAESHSRRLDRIEGFDN